MVSECYWLGSTCTMAKCYWLGSKGTPVFSFAFNMYSSLNDSCFVSPSPKEIAALPPSTPHLAAPLWPPHPPRPRVLCLAPPATATHPALRLHLISMAIPQVSISVMTDRATEIYERIISNLDAWQVLVLHLLQVMLTITSWRKD